MSKWEDKYFKEHKLTFSVAHFGPYKVVVHKLKGNGGTWYLSTEPRSFYLKRLCRDLCEAKIMAEDLLIKMAQNILGDINNDKQS